MNNVQTDEATITDACYECLMLENCPVLMSHKDATLKQMNLALRPFNFLLSWQMLSTEMM